MPLKAQPSTKPFPWQKLKRPVVGVDEVGRGCLAGRVYAAACLLDESKDFSEFTDSKKLTPEKRELLSAQIWEEHQIGIGFADEAEIEELNILHAALLAMRRAVEQLGLKTGHLLVDGNFPVPGLENWQQTCLVKGDLRAAPVAAASIVAKVARDAYITELAKKYPGYGLEKHKGYSTPAHKEAIRTLGPTCIHRRGFAGVKEYL